MAISTITSWLNSKGSFALGVDLLTLHGHPTPAQLFFFSCGEDGHSRNVLTAALRAVNERSTTVIPAGPKAVVAPSPANKSTERAVRTAFKSDPGTDIPEHQLPEELRPLRRELRDLHRNMVFLRGRLTSVPDGPELGKVAGQIVHLREKINAGWIAIEYWRATGKPLAGGTAPQTVDRPLLMKERNTLRVRLSEIKHGKRKAPQDRIEAMKARKAQLDRILNEPVEA